MTVLETVSDRMRQVWETGNYSPIAVRSVPVSAQLVQAVDVHFGERVLDIAAGTGNTALAAARRGANVIATDFVEAPLETAKARAAAEGVPLEVQVADAQQLPFDDNSFDVVLSTFGVMFAPDHQRAADEMVRVCRPGGRIGMANWTPESITARIAAITNSYVPPAGPAGPPPTKWGTEDYCRELFGDRIATLTVTPRIVEFFGASAEHLVELNRRYFPPARAAFAALDPARQKGLAADLAEAFESGNRATDGTIVSCITYVEVVATLR